MGYCIIGVYLNMLIGLTCWFAYGMVWVTGALGFIVMWLLVFLVFGD